ncbi:hypothetical protein B0H14DRAFT_2213989, partial [Mycena olivaceomarginata]
PVSLRGKTMKCIIKLANIHLTPEQPEYEGGSWHVEGTIQIRSCCISPLRAYIGMANESIVASGIYYYDGGNISESELSFCVSLGEPDYHGHESSYKDRQTTKAGRALAWPNFFQHRVSPFKLADPSNPGHRKILAIFLVNPTQDCVVSVTDVPSQQAAW